MRMMLIKPRHKWQWINAHGRKLSEQDPKYPYLPETNEALVLYASVKGRDMLAVAYSSTEASILRRLYRHTYHDWFYVDLETVFETANLRFTIEGRTGYDHIVEKETE